MSYSELIQGYFERSVALQWYWTVFILVIGGVLGFSAFRQRPDLITTLLVMVLFAGFAYKNLGAIEATAEERHAFLTAAKAVPDEGPGAADVRRARTALDPVMPAYDIPAARYFHIACSILTVAFLGAAEWRRRQATDQPAAK
jgi:hypothetical protein